MRFNKKIYSIYC